MDPFIPLVVVVVGALLAVLGVPLWRERVPPNRLYGFRTPRTVSDARVWYPANRVLGLDLTLAGLAMIALAGLGWAAGALGFASVALGLTVATTLPLFVALAHGFWKASVVVAEIDGLLAPDVTAGSEAASERRPAQRPRQTE